MKKFLIGILMLGMMLGITGMVSADDTCSWSLDYVPQGTCDPYENPLGYFTVNDDSGEWPGMGSGFCGDLGFGGRYYTTAPVTVTLTMYTTGGFEDPTYPPWETTGTFLGWTGDINSTDNPVTFTLQAGDHLNIIAVFEEEPQEPDPTYIIWSYFQNRYYENGDHIIRLTIGLNNYDIPVTKIEAIKSSGEIFYSTTNIPSYNTWDVLSNGNYDYANYYWNYKEHPGYVEYDIDILYDELPIEEIFENDISIDYTIYVYLENGEIFSKRYFTDRSSYSDYLPIIKTVTNEWTNPSGKTINVGIEQKQLYVHEKDNSLIIEWIPPIFLKEYTWSRVQISWSTFSLILIKVPIHMGAVVIPPNLLETLKQETNSIKIQIIVQSQDPICRTLSNMVEYNF